MFDLGDLNRNRLLPSLLFHPVSVEGQVWKLSSALQSRQLAVVHLGSSLMLRELLLSQQEEVMQQLHLQAQVSLRRSLLS